MKSTVKDPMTKALSSTVFLDVVAEVVSVFQRQGRIGPSKLLACRSAIGSAPLEIHVICEGGGMVRALMDQRLDHFSGSLEVEGAQVENILLAVSHGRAWSR